MYKVRDVVNVIEKLAPVCLAEKWDNVGLLAGREDKEINKILLALDPTSEVVDEAAAWGADLLITHEPTFYSHRDVMEDTDLIAKKLKLVEESGVVLYRYHDSMHAKGIDEISEGFLHRMGVCGDRSRSFQPRFLYRNHSFLYQADL